MYALILKKTDGYLPIPIAEPVEFIATDKPSDLRTFGDTILPVPPEG